MDIDTFMRVVGSFADSPNSIDRSKNNLILQVRDELMEVKLIRTPVGLACEDSNGQCSAERWIVERLARLDTLARRIQDYIPDDPFMIPASAALSDVLDRAPEGHIANTKDALTETTTLIESLYGAFASSIVYVTSDAGEGKTSLLNSIARKQAIRYLQRSANWLVLPVALGGRPFIRLDDVIIGSLANNLRFPFYYFDSVIELIRMGVLALALDGFEEMFIENASGDAISSLGTLVSRLQSEGCVLVAARRAYFRYRNADTQARLFQALGQNEVQFAEVSLNRWTKADFLQMGQRVGITDPEPLYHAIEGHLGADHPLLCRAVLARRLLEEYRLSADPMSLLSRLANASGEDYFEEFVSALLERESQTKWIDRTGEAAQPLLSTEEHHILLSYVAEEMWISSVEALPENLLATVADVVAVDVLGKEPVVHRQVRERIKQHALLAQVAPTSRLTRFDHDDFRNFYLGRRLGDLILDSPSSELLRSMLAANSLPDLAVRVATARIGKRNGDIPAAVAALCGISATETAISHSRANCGQLALALVRGRREHTAIALRDLYFGLETFDAPNLSNVAFGRCLVLRSGLSDVNWKNVSFSECSIDRLDLSGQCRFTDVAFDQASIPKAISVCAAPEANERVNFAPEEVGAQLAKLGISIRGQANLGLVAPVAEVEYDDEFVAAERALRLFRRATAVNEDTFKARLGTAATLFVENVLPALQRAGVLREVQYRGAGIQRRFRLVADLAVVDRASTQARGGLAKFIELLEVELKEG